MTPLVEKLNGDLVKDLFRPYSEIMEQQSKMLFEITKKAQKTPIYKDKVKIIEDVERISELPLTFYDEIESKIKKYGLEACLLKPPYIEAQTAGTTGVPKKIYYAEEDIDRISLLTKRIFHLLNIHEGDTIWSLGAPPPYISGYMFEFFNRAGYKATYTYITKPQDLIKGLKRVSKSRENFKGMIGFPGTALLVAQIIENSDNFKKTVTEKMKEKFGILGNIFSSLYLHGLRFDRLDEIIKNIEILLLGGEPTEAYREKLKLFYTNAQLFELYGSTELLFGMVQLSKNRNLNPILDWFIPEIARPEDIRRAKKNPEYPIEAIPWWKWYNGLKGELIITRNSECLPLIRYPTGDLVEVVSSKETLPIKLCNEVSSITLPEVKFLGRSIEILPFDASEDEMLIFSVARVYPSEIKAKLNSIEQLKMRHFILNIYRPTTQRPFPRWELKIIPEEKITETEKEKIISMVMEKINETELKQTLETFSLTYPTEKLFQVEITEPEKYKEIEKEIMEKISRKTPLGQIKPKHVHFISEEAK